MQIGRRGVHSLSQLTIDSPLAMGPHGITMDAGVLVDGKDVSLLNPIGWALIAEVSDVNVGDILQLDTGVIDPYDVYMVMVYMRSNLIGNILRCILNNDTSAEYDFVTQTHIALALTEGGGSWKLIDEMNDTQSALGIWYILGKKDADGRLGLFGGATPGRVNACKTTVRAELTKVLADVTRIKLYTDDNATGWIKIFGMNK